MYLPLKFCYLLSMWVYFFKDMFFNLILESLTYLFVAIALNRFCFAWLEIYFFGFFSKVNDTYWSIFKRTWNLTKFDAGLVVHLPALQIVCHMRNTVILRTLNRKFVSMCIFFNLVNINSTLWCWDQNYSKSVDKTYCCGLFTFKEELKL